MVSPKLALSIVCVMSMNWVFADFTWTGGGGSNNWSDAGNWGGTAPSGSSQNLIFPAGQPQLTNVDNIPSSNLSIARLTIGTGYTMQGTAGNPIFMADGSQINCTGTISISNVFMNQICAIALTGPSTSVTAMNLSRTDPQGDFDIVGSSPGGMGAGTLYLGGTNTYAGATNIYDGARVVCLANNVIPTISGLGIQGTNTAPSQTPPGSTLNLNGTSQSPASISLASDAYIIDGSSSSPGNFTINFAPGVAIAGTLGTSSGGNNFSITNNSSDNVSITQAQNFYTGGTILNAGSLFPSTYLSLGTGPITINGAEVVYQAAVTGTLANPFIVNGPISYLTIIPSAGVTADVNLSGAFSGSGLIQVSDTLGGTSVNVTLSGANTAFAGGFGIDDDVNLIASSQSNLGTGPITLLGGTFSPAGTITLTNPVVVNAGGTSTITSTTATFNGLLTGGSSSTLVLSGTNTFSGMAVSSNFAITTNAGSATTFNGTLSGSNGATLTLTRTGLVGGLNVNGAFTITSDANPTSFSAPVTAANNSTLNLNGNYQFGALTLDPSNTFTVNSLGTTNFTGLVSGGDASVLNLTGTNRIASVAAIGAGFTINGVISGTQALSKSGTGTLVLNNANTYTGNTSINAGSIGLNTVSATLSSGTITMANNTFLLTSVDGSTVANPITIVGGAGFGVAAGTTNYSGVISGGVNGTNAFYKEGPGRLVLSNTNSYTGGTQVDAGTLSISSAANINAISSNTPVTLNGGTLEVTASLTTPSSVPFIVGGTSSISSNNQLVVQGNLTGVDGGILNLVGSGTSLNTVIVAPNGTFTINGLITGNQALTKENTGTLLLSGANTYTGGTLITGGNIGLISTTASLGSGAITMSNDTGLLTALDGTVIPNSISILGTAGFGVSGGTTTLSGIISGGVDGTPSIAKYGSGTLSLTRANTYVGDTSLTAGVIQVSHSSALGTGDVLMSDGTTLISAADGIVLTNDISTTGTGTIQVNTGTTTVTEAVTGDSLVKSGAGSLVLSALGSDLTTGVTVAGGELAVMGTLATPTLTVYGVLSGTGTITGDVDIFGVADPGASPGTLTINGNYTQELGSVLLNQVTPLVSSEILVHGGNVQIQDFATFSLFPDLTMGAYGKDDTFPVIEVDPGFTVSGQFTNFISTSPSLSGYLTYTDRAVTLHFLKALTGYGFEGNPGRVANVLDSLLSVVNSDTINILGSLFDLDASETYEALDRMHPALYKGMAVAQENNAAVVRDAVGQRFLPLLNGAECRSCSERPFHVWASGIGDFIHQSSAKSFNSPQTGYHDSTWGAVSGVDYNFLDAFYAGVLGAYTHSKVEWRDNYGEGAIKSGYAGVYGSAIGSLFYGNLSVVGAWNDYNAQRNITYFGVDETAYNKHHGKQLTTHLDAGLNFSVGRVKIRPFDSVDWIIQNEEGYDETGAGIYNLDVDKSHANMVRNELGVDFGSCGYWGRAKFSGDGKVSYVSDSRLSGSKQTSVFSNTSIPFTVEGYFPNRSLFSFGGNLTATILKDLVSCKSYKNGAYDYDYLTTEDVLTLTISYNGVFGYKYNDNTVSCQLNFGF
jgi:autotransporter-associated beta strand protein